MVSQAEQSQLIRCIDDLNGLEHAGFSSASNIESNFKINMAEALDRDVALRQKVASYIVGELESYRVNTIVAVGGAVNLAKDVAAIADFDFVAINSIIQFPGQKKFSVDFDSRVHTNKYRSKLAFVEDVSSTWGTVRRALSDTDIKDPEVAISAWRRGVPAPAELSPGQIVVLNALNNRRPPLEMRTPYPVRGIIERPVPLYISEDSRLADWLPEVGDEDRDF